jgi:hypothetical protein
MTSNPYHARFNPMSSSSMFSPPANNEFKRNLPFQPTTTPFDPFQRTQEQPSPPSIPETFPRAMASQSMIATNSASSKRATFGKLDSMARKVTTTFKDESAQESANRHESPIGVEDSTSQSMIMPGSGMGRPVFGMNRMQ